ncbi:kinase-like domain-containing protein [Aspergillus multicolor]|uniref:protein kinase family protein n=1 Tax=Aspergillus multicolor TaxID=41759 RepID=UPI003CCD5F04
MRLDSLSRLPTGYLVATRLVKPFLLLRSCCSAPVSQRSQNPPATRLVCQSSAMAQIECWLIREKLYDVAKDPDGNYFPRSAILSVFNTDDCLRQVYFCTCDICRQDFRIDSLVNPDNRKQTFYREELLDKYATVYALLICLKRAGLIRFFQKHRKYLNGSDFFTRDSLQFLIDERVRGQSIIHDILDNQYRFQLRAIDRSREPITLDPLEFLPIRQDTEQKGRGSFGQVYGFEFAYQEYRGEKMQHISRFARKIFQRDTAGLVEWFNLLHFDELRHPHLMSALAAFWHRDQFSIVFEEAEQTLDAYLKSDGGIAEEELWSQVQGLADGLAFLHGSSGSIIAYHGDLKPANILIVRGVMKIADFGLLHVRYTSSIANPLETWPSSDINASTRPYAGPSGSKPAMDVWSFGAILSEIAVFDLDGTSGLQRYRQIRLNDSHEDSGFHSYGFHHAGVLKRPVTETMDGLQEFVHNGRQQQNNALISPFHQRFFQQRFFDLIRGMLSDGHVYCPTSQHVAEELNEIHRQALLQPEGFSPQGDIWDDVRNERVPNSPSRSNCRLQVNESTLVRLYLIVFRCAKLLELPSSPKCGLLLHDGNEGRSLLVQCILYNYRDVNIYVIQEPCEYSCVRCIHSLTMSSHEVGSGAPKLRPGVYR